MNVRKIHLGKLPMVYAVAALPTAGGRRYLAATELCGEWRQYDGDNFRSSIASHQPGGVLGLIPLPDRSGRVLAIEQAYPIYNFSKAIIALAEPGEDPTAVWRKQLLAEVPFLHRIGLFVSHGRTWLMAATMCGAKGHQEDWSRPGAVYASPFDCATAATPVSFTPILEGLSRNHGMTIVSFRGEPTLFVSSREGAFALNHSVNQGADCWKIHHLLRHDVSDITTFDLDGDGLEEVVTIEPFHGNKVALYRQTADGLTLAAEWDAAFGHVAWSGIIRSRRCLLLGNRAGAKELKLLVFRGDGSLEFETVILDEQGGPANVSVIHESDRDLILSANHVRGEVALYEITG